MESANAGDGQSRGDTPHPGARRAVRVGSDHIALTANAFPEDVRACLAAGVNQLVATPVSRETLLNALM